MSASPTRVPQRVLLIDHDDDNGALLAHSIKRKFPHTSVERARSAEEALSQVQSENFDVVIVHRTELVRAVELIQEVRQSLPSTLIIAVSGVDRSEDVLAAGADGFLHADEWLRIGTVIGNALEHRAKESPGT